MPITRTRPVTIALVDDYDVVLKGLAHMFDDYRDRVVVAEIDANAALSDDIDIVLYDSFAQPESDHHEIAELVRNPRASVISSGWKFQV
jgi:DNA-binding NarL/FixJ family response regulator